jgi:iron complex outermembrane receptor protein
MDSCLHRPQGSSQIAILAVSRLTPQGVRLRVVVLPRSFGMCLSVVGLVLLGLVMSLPALAAPKLQTFHIEAGDATVTLNEFSRQSSLQLLFDYNIVRGRKTRAISGELEASAALEQMLADTGLVFDFVNDRTLAVTLNSRASPGSAVAEAPTAPRRTQSEEAQSVAHEGSGSADLPQEIRPPVLEEITILGTHLRGEEPVGEHVVHLGREDINNNPAGTVQDFLRTFPQTFGGGPTEDTHYFSEETGTNSGLGSGINLRGLGAKATLVLINGKRMAPSGTEAAFSDVENIPLSAIERMDILSDGASALYGSDAVGGVVNFVMRDNFTGAETLLRGGSGSRNTLDEYQVAQTLGKRWDSGNGMLSLEFYKRGALPAYARRYTNSNLTSLGGSNFDIPQANPGNILAGGQSYAIPSGQDGTRLVAGDLIPGTQNLANKYAGADILPSQKRWSLYSSGKQALTDSMTLFGNSLVSRREAQQRNGGYPMTLVLTNANPFYVNPAGGDAPVTVDYNSLDDLGPMYSDVVVKNLNLTLGVDIDVGSAWKVSLYGNYAQEKENQFTGGLVDIHALGNALLDSNRESAFNPFGAGSHTNPATLRSIETSTRYYANSKLRTADVTADGPLAHLPGGDIKLAVGVDRRNQVYDTFQAATALNEAIAINDGRNVVAAFGEIRVPVFGKANSRRGLRRLELSVAGRYENYSDFGHATTPKLGLAWSPLATVALRGTWGRSIRAPTLAELNTASNSVLSYFLPDKTSPAGLSPVLIEVGKNPDLTVERARSWTAGFDIDTSRWFPGLTFSATYFNIRFRDRIQAPAFGANILNDPNFVSFVTRNPSAALVGTVCTRGIYIAVGGPDCAQFGPNAILDLRSQNLESVHTAGIDLNTVYERRWAPGTLSLRLDGTYLLDFTQQANPDAPTVRLLNTQNNPINIKLRGMLAWQQRFWGATLGINFQNHYRDTVSEPQRNIRSYTTFDAQLRYAPPAFGTTSLQNTSIELNAINVFNHSPPFLNNSSAGLGYDQENADPFGRLVSIQARKSW